MQFEEFDDKVKQAADHHHPAYDEQAWSKMEKLLDKHLPQEEKKKRRFIFFLLFFLLLGGGAWLLVSKPWKKQDSKMADAGIVSVKGGNEKETNQNTDTKNKTVFPGPVLKDPSGIPTVPVAEIKTGDPENQKLLPAKQIKQNRFLVIDRKIKTDPSKPVAKSEVVDKLSDKPSVPEWLDNNRKPDIEKKGETIVSPQVPLVMKNEIPEEKEKQPIAETGKTEINKQGEEELKPENKTATGELSKKKEKVKNKKPNSFFFAFSAGPDLSFVSSDKLGATKLVAGGGIGFTLHERFTIRTGFYSGRKVYTTSPGSYNPPASWWAYYPNLQKVDADCKVYEIPILLSYNFGQKKNYSWFASAGVSSLLMKKEVYDYFYKYTVSGPVITKKWTISDQNKHYFSIVTLSGGYQQKIGKHISLMAEPYIKLPLTGVGFGKVKLNSGGILFTVGVSPFNKQKIEVKNLH